MLCAGTHLVPAGVSANTRSRAPSTVKMSKEIPANPVDVGPAAAIDTAPPGGAGSGIHRRPGVTVSTELVLPVPSRTANEPPALMALAA